MSNKWTSSLWDCFNPFDKCALTCCCPCLVYGENTSRFQDPNLKEGKSVNGDCCLFVLLSYCGVNWVLMMLKRGEMRQKFGIEGSTGEDCILSCCCPCCVLMQQSKELDAQATRLQGGQPGYQAPQPMDYPK